MPIRRAPAILAASAALVATTTAGTGPHAFADDPASPGYTVTVTGTGPWTNPDDIPASPFLDKDGMFYY